MLKQTMNRPLIPDRYSFLLPNSLLCTKISLHKCCACAASRKRSPGKLIEYSYGRASTGTPRQILRYSGF